MGILSWLKKKEARSEGQAAHAAGSKPVAATKAEAAAPASGPAPKSDAKTRPAPGPETRGSATTTPAPQPERSEDAAALPARIEPTPEQRDRAQQLVAEVARCWEQGIETLPPFPPLAGRLVGLLGSEELDVREVVKVIGLEPTVAAGVLRASNSALYSRGIEITNLKQAVVRLGPRESARVALSMATRQLFDLSRRAAEARFEHLQQAFWRHALTVAFTASGLAVKYQRGDPERALIAGMLHDIGKNVALAYLSELPGASQESDTVVLLVCREVHEAFGEDLARRWQLPEVVSQTCGHHHGAGPLTNENRFETQWVRIASLVDTRLHGPVLEPDLERSIINALSGLELELADEHQMVADLSAFLTQIGQKVAGLMA